MKLAATIALGVALSFAGSVNAQDAVDAPTTAPLAPVAISAPSGATYSTQGYSRRTRQTSPSFFGRVIELERQKNAWLRRTFLGGR